VTLKYMASKKKILFLCTHNAVRSQIAEGFVNALCGNRYEAYSAGPEPTKVHPCAITVMAEADIDISNQRAKSVDEFDNVSVDCVVTLCAEAQENCPIFPGAVKYVHHPVDDPVVVPGSGNEQCDQFRRARDQIKVWIDAMFGA
jgi:arsenate reductase (thioredoxin)